MSPLTGLLLIAWFAFVLTASCVSAFILHRRGRTRAVYAAIVFLGALGSYPLFLYKEFAIHWIGVGIASLTLSLAACRGLQRPRLPSGRCWSCGYDLAGETPESSARCPECGAARPSMKGHCLECKADVRQAIAGGSIICPHCRAPLSAQH
jgi:DNA-directed RNA polymerase subunit RPC12/RpoP